MRRILHPEEQDMPLYEYRCRSCGRTFEKLRRIDDADRNLDCPECHSEEVERRLSSFASPGCKSSGSGRFT